MTTKLEKFWKFFRNDIGELVKKPSSATETGAEVSKTSLELAIALGLLGSPLAPAGVAVAGLSFVGLASKGIKFYQDRTKDKLSLEECVTIASRLAYVESFERILYRIKDNNQNLFKKIENIQPSDELGKLTENFLFDPQEARKAITCFRETKLAQELNRHLSFSLKQAGLTPTEANIFTQRITWNTQRYMNQALAEVNVEMFYGMSDVSRQDLEKYQSIDNYLEQEIAKQPQEKVFAENFTFQDIYIPLKAQPLDSNGKEYQQKQPVNLEFWANDLLQNPEKANKVIFIQAEPGRGKTVFCRMFADWIRQNLYPIWTPVLIRLRDIRIFEKQFENTLRAAVDRDFAQNDDGWLTDKNIRYLFLLDGFDELLMEGRTSGGLEEFLKQVGAFGESCHRNPEKGHRVLITGRTLALQSIERYMPSNLERVKILPMDEAIQKQWFEKWSVQFGHEQTAAFQQFLHHQKCPKGVRELAQEPLLLYLLAAMHRDRNARGERELTEEMFTVSKDAIYRVSTSKILIYQKSLDWVLTKQRPEILQREITEQDTEDLRRILTEAGLCVVHSGGECAAMSMIEKRLGRDETAKEFLETARRRIGDNPLRNALAAFYLQTGRQTGSVEFAHKSFSEFLFAERLKESIESWTEPKRRGRGFNIQQEQMDWEIYDLLGYGGLTPEIVEYLMGLITASEDFRPVELFQRLENFYQRWCDGEFIDGYTETLPQKKSRQLHEQNIELGQRQVDIYAGLNVMILLLELHRYAQERDDLKEQIIFYPSGQSQNNYLTLKFLRIINYSNAIRFRTFNILVGQYLSSADLRRVYLNSADLIGADFRNADLSSASLRRVYLSRADLNKADFSNANLSSANLSSTNLISANLIGADLSSADLSSANLTGADLSEADLCEADLRGANLIGADLRGADLRGADLSSANLGSANLSSANLSSVNLIKADLSSADLSSTNFSRADLGSADLSSANLVNTNLSNANLGSANLINANLSSSNLSSTNLSSANLSSANLISANLISANLSSTNLSGANLAHVFLGNIRWDQNTNWEGVRGLETAKNLPEALKRQLGLDIDPKKDAN